MRNLLVNDEFILTNFSQMFPFLNAIVLDRRRMSIGTIVSNHK